MGRTIGNCVGFWEMVRFSVSPCNKNRSLQTLKYPYTISYWLAGVRSAHKFQLSADIALFIFKSVASKWLAVRTGTLLRCH
jgi:hypothetical protein